jgi:hypothetical protein
MTHDLVQWRTLVLVVLGFRALLQVTSKSKGIKSLCLTKYNAIKTYPVRNKVLYH